MKGLGKSRLFKLSENNFHHFIRERKHMALQHKGLLMKNPLDLSLLVSSEGLANHIQDNCTVKKPSSLSKESRNVSNSAGLLAVGIRN